MDKFHIFLVTEKDFLNEEQEGALRKDWFQTLEGKVLFKDAGKRPYNPEIRNDWPEKIVSELADRLNLPAARYELAQLETSTGIKEGSISFKLPDYGGKRTALESSFENVLPKYNYGSDYSVFNVIFILEQQNVQLPPDYSLPNGINDGVDLFVGALMLDAYTLNIDRHCRNFDLISIDEGKIQYLSPIFDNGRSLGSYLQDEAKVDRSISDYAISARSSITVDGYIKNGLEAFKEAAKLRPKAAKIWQNQLSKIDPQQIKELFDRLPDGIITPKSKEFAINLLEHNQKQLLDLEIKLSPSETQQLRVEAIAPVLIDYLKLNNQKRVENDKSIVEFYSENKILTYENKTDKQEYLSAQYIDNHWADKGSNISQSKESYFTDLAKAKIKRLKAKKLEANQSEQSNKKPKRRRRS